MHRDQQIPLALGPALRDHAAERMALVAGRFGVGVGGVLEVDQSSLGFPRRRLGFFRREAQILREVLDDLARRCRIDVQAVQRRHALNLIVCQPSGVLRWNEMRDICPCRRADGTSRTPSARSHQ